MLSKLALPGFRLGHRIEVATSQRRNVASFREVSCINTMAAGLKYADRAGILRASARRPWFEKVPGQSMWLWLSKPMGSHFGWWVNSPPILAYFSGDWDVHRGYGILTHGNPCGLWLSKSRVTPKWHKPWFSGTRKNNTWPMVVEF